MPSRSALSASRRLLTPLKEKDRDTQRDNRKHIFDELKEILPNGCFTSFSERAGRADASTDAAGVSNANLITQLVEALKPKRVLTFKDK